MIVMDVTIDNFFAFKNFHMNMSYPKRIVNSYISEEFLQDRPNFRYKKVNILMGANATGKTSFGRMLMRIFNFMDTKQFERLTEAICDPQKKAFFSMDFITTECRLYRINVTIPPRTGDRYKASDLDVTVKDVVISKKDNYETCKKNLDSLGSDKKCSFIEELDKIKGLSWRFEYPDDFPEAYKAPTRNLNKYVKILEYTLKALDPSIEKVSKIPNVTNAFAVHMAHQDIIIQDGEVIDTKKLSSGTKAGIAVAGFLASIKNGDNGFYYCDEKFSYIQSDVEKAFLTLMITSLKQNDQLFFTTHNMDILDLQLPKHSFTFLKKDCDDSEQPIKCVCASEYLKRNTDSVRHAAENDLFSAAPNLDMITEIARI